MKASNYKNKLRSLGIFTICIFLTLLSACEERKGIDPDGHEGLEVAPTNAKHKPISTAAVQESKLFQIKEGGATMLNIKGLGLDVIIRNKKPETALETENNQYKIVDAAGKKYTFTSATVFAERTVTPLRGAIKVFKNEQIIFQEKYDFKDFHPCTTVDEDPNQGWV